MAWHPAARFALIALFFTLAGPESASAQSILAGVVRMPNGQVASDATVVALEESTGLRFETRASGVGTYAFLHLPEGLYTVVAYLDPDSPLRRRVSGVAVKRQKTALDLVLAISREEEVTVNSSGGVPSGAALGETTSARDLEAGLHAHGRTVQSALFDVPGIVVTESTGTLAQFSAAGQRRFANQTSIDGINADLGVDAVGPGPGIAGSGTLPAVATTGSIQTLVPLAAVEEIQVRTGGASAEFAASPGAQTRIVTRAGTNRLSLEAFGTWRPEALAASDWFSSAGLSPPKEQQSSNIGLSGGSPIVRGRMFSFLAWERQGVRRTTHTAVPVPSESSRTDPRPFAPVLNAFPAPNGGDLGQGLSEFASDFPAASRLWTLSARIDGVTLGQRAFVRANIGASDGDTLLGLRKQMAVPSFRHAEETKSKTATAGWNSVLSRLTHELRLNATGHEGASAAFPDNPSALAALNVPADARVGLFVFPGDSGLLLSGKTGRSVQSQLALTDTWAVAVGRHEIRFGVKYARVTVESDPPAETYLLRFNGVEDVLSGRVRSTNVQKALPGRALRETFAGFVQDDLRLKPRLTLGYGLRYGVSLPPKSRNGLEPELLAYDALPKIELLPRGQPLWDAGRSQLAPRLSAAMLLGKGDANDTVIRGGWGIAFDERSSPGVAPFGGGAPYVSNLVAGPSVLGNQPGPPIGSRVEYFAISPGLRAPKTYQWDASVERAARFGRVRLAYVGARARNLPYTEGWQTGTFSDQIAIRAFSDAGESSFHAFIGAYSKTLGRDLSIQANYTRSRTIDNDSGEMTNPPIALVSPSANQGAADFDRPHVLNATTSFRVPPSRLPDALTRALGDWQFDLKLTVQSGAAVSVLGTALFEGNPYELRPDIVEGVPVWLDDPLVPSGQRLNPAAFVMPSNFRQGSLPRNAIRSTPLRQADLLVSRTFRRGRSSFQLRLEVLNVLNTANFAPPIAILGDSMFGRPVQSYAEGLGSGTLRHGGLTPLNQRGGPRAIQFGFSFKM